MPEYLAPGVYVEEVSFRSKSIEGVSTTTTGFIGPTRYGPITLEPDLVTSLGEFEHVYGDGQQLIFRDPDNPNKSLKPMHNFVWHAVRAFFEEGGKRLYVVRVFRPTDAMNEDGDYARYTMSRLDSAAASPIATEDADTLTVRARFPGSLGNLRVRLTLSLGQSLLDEETIIDPATGNKIQIRTAKALLDNDIVWVSDINSPIGGLASPIGQSGDFYRARSFPNPATTSRNNSLAGAIHAPRFNARCAKMPHAAPSGGKRSQRTGRSLKRSTSQG